MIELQTKQQVTKKFVIGVVIILVSLLIGKLVLIPIILFPGSAEWRISMILVYLLSWIIMFIGIWLAGVEGYRLATHKYKEYQKKTVNHVRKHSRKVARETVKAVMKTGRVAKKTGRAAKKTAQKMKRVKLK